MPSIILTIRIYKPFLTELNPTKRSSLRSTLHPDHCPNQLKQQEIYPPLTYVERLSAWFGLFLVSRSPCSLQDHNRTPKKFPSHQRLYTLYTFLAHRNSKQPLRPSSHFANFFPFKLPPNNATALRLHHRSEVFGFFSHRFLPSVSPTLHHSFIDSFVLLQRILYTAFKTLISLMQITWNR
ncbi:hypothetical protein PCASD_00120 [Puccinia coronata f. sp. avenae]|uniref:Uncharacterized protein n=1 Tax=Puccinia coronata f. sp. avenae TaxID=200324 RepID=A0A2N5VR21_9BASI|nr:hypothetical protein PCASD_00120 [Puccinia coronata f. sp. avenae]